MNDIIKILKSLKESSLLINGISETIQNQAKGQKIGFLWMLLHTIGPILLKAKDTIRAAEGTFRAGQKIYCHLILLKILKYEGIIKINLNLMVFMQQISYLK